MYARNIYIALRDPGQDTIRYVYDVDEKDSPQQPDAQHPLLSVTESPTAWVIRHGKPLSVNAEEFQAEVAKGHEWGFGANPEHWLGMRAPVSTCVVAENHTTPKSRRSSFLPSGSVRSPVFTDSAKRPLSVRPSQLSSCGWWTS